MEFDAALLPVGCACSAAVLTPRLTVRGCRRILPGMPATGTHGLAVGFADPIDPALDSFESGVAEVDDYFQSRQWFDISKDRPSPPTYRFETAGGQVVGYAAVGFRNCPHDRDSAITKGKYLVVYAAGVDQQFHGVVNESVPGESLAVSIFRVLEQFALDKEGCVGLYLWVRSDNERAIRFYEKFGFSADPDGPQRRDERTPHLTMRKLLASAVA